jgi:hypothetical protein
MIFIALFDSLPGSILSRNLAYPVLFEGLGESDRCTSIERSWSQIRHLSR